MGIKKAIKEIEELTVHEKYIEKRDFVEENCSKEYLKGLELGFDLGQRNFEWAEVIGHVYRMKKDYKSEKKEASKWK